MPSTIPRLALLALSAFALNASAHITLETRNAEAGSYYKAVFKVGHGCEGSSIREIIVNVPAGVVGVKPMPKAGWQLDIRQATLDKPYTSHGKTISETPGQIRWHGGVLPDAHYDEFVLISRLPEQPGKLYWKVTQICDKGQIDWAEIPAEGKPASDYTAPAVLLNITPKPVASSEHKH